MLQPAGFAAETIAEIGIVITVGAVVIFAGVMGLLTWTLMRRSTEQRKVRALLWVIGGGVIFPALVLSALLVYTTVRSLQLAPLQKTDGMVIAVTGAMWWWEVRYRDPGSGREVLLANEVRVPVGRPVTIGLTSADVIHSFWVPQLAGKVDMVPGRVHQLRIHARQPGVYRGQCAEYCGDQHAKMALHVVAVAPEEFDRWLQAQASPAVSPTDAIAQRGRQLFTEQRCNACHTVRGIAEASRLGPDLTHVASRLYIGAGELPTQRANFREWVAHIQRIKPGARMPSFDELDEASLTALAAFLDGLK